MQQAGRVHQVASGWVNDRRPDDDAPGPPAAAARRSLLAAMLVAPLAGPRVVRAQAVPGAAPPGAPKPAGAGSSDPTRFSSGVPGGALPSGWMRVPLNESKTPTEWALVADEGRTVLRAHARASVSLVMRAAAIDLRRTPVVAWRWKIEGHPADADNSKAAKEDSVARLVFAFEGDRDSLPASDRVVMRVARSMSGRDLPYATLMYVVSGVAEPGTVVPNPHTRRVQMVVASSAVQAGGRWVDVARDLSADFRKAFGEAPGRLMGYGVMSDTDNTRAEARAWYGDIEFRTAPARGPA